MPRSLRPVPTDGYTVPSRSAPAPGRPRSTHITGKEGTAAHLLLAWSLTHKMLASGERVMRPMAIEVEGETFEVTDEMITAIQRVPFMIKGATEIWSEQRVVPFPSVAEACNGTADIIAWYKKAQELKVIDLKYGRGPVPVEDNPQLLLYAMGAIHLAKVKPKYITLGIYQPRVSSELITQRLTADQFKTRLRPLLAAIQHGLKSPEEAVVGNWCKWCNHHLTCELFQARLNRATAEAAQDTDVRTVANLFPSIKAWVEEADKVLRGHLLDGHALPNLKLVHGAGRRQWAMSKEHTIDRLKGLVESIDDVYQLASVAQVEKHVQKIKRPQFSELVTRGSPSVQMVTIDDPRPAIGAAQDFDDTDGLDDFTGG